MIDRDAVKQILEQYTKHGWQLRRVLLSDDMRSNLGDLRTIFGDAEVLGSSLDAAWFSRSSKPDTTAWELRHLAQLPYALVTGIPEPAETIEAEGILSDTEAKMRDVIGQRRS